MSDTDNTKRVSIKDVAEIAGVAISTVSLVVNNKKGVAEKTRLRVLSVIEKLNYTPNAIARGLVTRKTKTIGLIIPDNSDPFCSELARGIEDTSFDNGYSVVLCNSDSRIDKEKLYVSLMTEQNVAGLIIVPVAKDDSTLLSAIKANIPIVCVDRLLEIKGISQVVSDNFHGAFEIVKHLAQLGHTRIACIADKNDLSPFRDRIAGYKAVLNEYSLAIDERLIIRINSTIDDGFFATKKLLESNLKPTAIFCTSDVVAFGCMDAILKSGLSIPEDISVVGFDNIRFSALCRVPLTTVDQSKYEMGKIACNLLFKKINSEKSSPERIVLKTKIIIRESSGVCRY